MLADFAFLQQLKIVRIVFFIICLKQRNSENEFFATRFIASKNFFNYFFEIIRKFLTSFFVSGEMLHLSRN